MKVLKLLLGLILFFAFLFHSWPRNIHFVLALFIALLAPSFIYFTTKIRAKTDKQLRVLKIIAIVGWIIVFFFNTPDILDVPDALCSHYQYVQGKPEKYDYIFNPKSRIQYEQSFYINGIYFYSTDSEKLDPNKSYIVAFLPHTHSIMAIGDVGTKKTIVGDDSTKMFFHQ